MLQIEPLRLEAVVRDRIDWKRGEPRGAPLPGRRRIVTTSSREPRALGAEPVAGERKKIEGDASGQSLFFCCWKLNHYDY